MITKSQAMALKQGQLVHFTGRHECTRTVGPRGGVKERIAVARVTGKCKTWVRTPDRFHAPVMRGLYEHGAIDNNNAHCWHLASECPLLQHKG